jgi:hypothetical protein
MKHPRPGFVVAVAGLILLPSSVLAGGRGRGVVIAAPRGHVVVARTSPGFVRPAPRVLVAPRSVFPVFVDPWRFWGVSAFRRPFFPPVVASVLPGGVYASTLYTSPPVEYSSPMPTGVPAPEALPIPTVVEYPTGWYQLRGDGVTNPYVWVWIPKPPSPPDNRLTPPPVPPSEGPPAPLAQEPRSAAPRGELYRWVDEQGAVHWTDRLDRVPKRYRPQVQRLS